MEIKFDLVRIGNKRKNQTSELLLKQNVDYIKRNIFYFLDYHEVHENLNITLIIPSKGYSIKIDIRNLNNNIKSILRKELPNSIFRDSSNKILENINNPLF